LGKGKREGGRAGGRQGMRERERRRGMYISPPPRVREKERMEKRMEKELGGGAEPNQISLNERRISFSSSFSTSSHVPFLLLPLLLPFTSLEPESGG